MIAEPTLQHISDLYGSTLRARRFLKQGAFVTLNGRRAEKYAKRLVEDAITRFGNLDVLVNNAATAVSVPPTGNRFSSRSSGR